VVERQLEEDGLSREEMGREAFTERVWQWVEEYGGNISRQFRELGASLDYEDERFTMDPDYVRAVTKVFVHLYEKGSSTATTTWSTGTPGCERDLGPRGRAARGRGHLYEIDYPLESGSARSRSRRSAGDDAGRHRHRGEPLRRAVLEAGRREAPCCRWWAAGCRSSPTSTWTRSSGPAR
jgi:hypothetical protein